MDRWLSQTDDLTDYVRENHDVIADVLRTSRDPYARALALLKQRRGGTERDT